MAQIGYSKEVMEHFMNPRNVGVIENPDGYGKVGNPVCGDLMEIFIKVNDNKVDDIKFRTGLDVEAVLARGSDITRSIEKVYGGGIGSSTRALAGISSRKRQNFSGVSGNSTRGGQNTVRSPTMRGTPLTSSGAIWVPNSDRQGRPASAAA